MERKRQPLGKYPYKIAVSRAELRLLLDHRSTTGEPIQTYVRRLIRESQPDIPPPHFEFDTPLAGLYEGDYYQEEI